MSVPDDFGFLILAKSQESTSEKESNTLVRKGTDDMKQITIDRFDGIYAICEDKDKAFFAIETSELPQGAKAGDVLKITDDGALSIDVEETERRRARILEKQKKLMGL